MTNQPETNPRLLILVAVTSIYLVIPVIPFAYGWLKLPFAIAAILAAVVFIVICTKDVVDMVRRLRTQRHSDHRRSITASMGIIFAGILIAVWLLFSGTGGFGFQNPDHMASNALMRDLIVQDWPITIKIDGKTLNIVYYAAYFLPAAVIGKICGWTAANIAVFVWTTIGVVLAFIWFSILARVDLLKKSSNTLWLALMFCLSGGLDYIAFYFVRHEIPYVTFHLEPWAGFFTYPSNTSLLYWVPQQAIAAWLLVSFIICAPSIVVVRYLGMLLAVGLIWTPLAVIGLVPYLFIRLMLVLKRNEIQVDRITCLLNAFALFIGCVHALYIISNQFKFPLGMLWNFLDLRTGWSLVVKFWLFEFGFLSLLALLLLVYSAASIRRISATTTFLETIQRYFGIEGYDLAFVVTSLVTLILIPLFKVGYANDLSMRASIPSLFILWAFIARVTLIIPFTQNAKKHRNAIPAILQGATLAVVVLSFMTSMTEIARSIKFYSFGPPDEHTVPDSAEASELIIVEQRIGNSDSFFYRYLGR
ncbi:MAG: hypothetical protein JXB30_08980 [Anaerolineae bacterium]|nr:hypothetical protein [Anaerolineae bacterium]